MDISDKYISYAATGYFSKMMVDYVNGDEKLHPFYDHPVSLSGIRAAIDNRNQFATPRSLLVTELQKQYAGIQLNQLQQQNLDLLLQPNTYTICTAHQPNIFTGHLYFIYKILHAIKLAETLQQEMPEKNFVPVYYMGSEDADLEELGSITLAGRKLVWQTDQTGAVGRMKVDKKLLALIDTIAGQIGVLPHGVELIQMFRDAYTAGAEIQQATLKLVNKLFAKFGLLVVIPDNAELKKPFKAIVEKELTSQFSHKLIEATGTRLSEHYKVQASGREINFFYLTNNERERIEKTDGYFTTASGKRWDENEMLAEVKEHPGNFSANVILRGVFQEMILPNIAFIGGGGEIAYWLELKGVFAAAGVPFPVLVVRNSFLLIPQKLVALTHQLGFKITDLFKDNLLLTNTLVKRQSEKQLTLQEEKKALQAIYETMKTVAGNIDGTLTHHVSALYKKTQKTIDELERKMLRAERRKFESQEGQIDKLRRQLFPGNSLQERVDNFATYYAAYGNDWLHAIYKASLSLEQQFCLLEIEK